MLKDNVTEIDTFTKKREIMEELNKLLEGNEQKLMDAMMSKFYDLPKIKCQSLMEGKIENLSMDDIKRIKRKVKQVVEYRSIIL